MNEVSNRGVLEQNVVGAANEGRFDFPAKIYVSSCEYYGKLLSFEITVGKHFIPTAIF